MYYKYFSSWSAVSLQMNMWKMLIAIFDVPYYKRETARERQQERDSERERERERERFLFMISKRAAKDQACNVTR